MTPELSVIIVNHRSSAEAQRCVASLREAFGKESVAGEIVLVDCASGPEEASRLARIPADLHLFLPENRGYAGGLNAGLTRARGSRLLLSNADVVYFPGALTALLSAIEPASVGAAAPLAVWDAAGRLRLPPGFAPGFFRDLAQLLAERLAPLDDWRFAAWARETLCLWQNGGAARHLSGAVLATRRDVFDRVGGFDERYQFEYEETDWEDRLRSAGFRLLFVPSARVHHLWGSSASRNPETAFRRAASARAYRQARYGRLGRALLEEAARAARLRAWPLLPEPRVPAAAGAALALSPNPSRLPFAGADLEQDFRLPEEIAVGLPPGPWYFTVFRTADGRPLETLLWEKGT